MVETEGVAKATKEAGTPGVLAPRAERSAWARFFEAHKYVAGRWELAGVFDDKESAIAEARALIESNRSGDVRVLRVVMRKDRAGDITFSEQTIHRQSAEDESDPENTARVAHAWQEVEAAREKRRLDRFRERRASVEKARKSNDQLWLILRLTIIAWLALAAMVAFRQRLF